MPVGRLDLTVGLWNERKPDRDWTRKNCHSPSFNLLSKHRAFDHTGVPWNDGTRS